jgi:hypothetical protein
VASSGWIAGNLNTVGGQAGNGGTTIIWRRPAAPGSTIDTVFSHDCTDTAYCGALALGVNASGTVVGSHSEQSNQGGGVTTGSVLNGMSGPWCANVAIADNGAYLQQDCSFPAHSRRVINGVLGDDLTAIDAWYDINRDGMMAGMYGAGLQEGSTNARVYMPGGSWNMTKLISASSGWSLDQAVAINDKGDVAGLGQYNGDEAVFLATRTLTVNDTGDAPAKDASSGSCLTATGSCTLRSAIQAANALGGAQAIGFHIYMPSGGIPVIKLESALPKIRGALIIDGSTQPGTKANTPGVIIDGSGTKRSADGFDLVGDGGGLKGLVVTGFKGTGAVLEGASTTVTSSVFFKDGTGVEPMGANQIVGPTDIFFDNGNYEALAAYEASLGGKKATLEQYDAAATAFGAGVLVRKPKVSNLTISKSLLGVHGSELGSLMPPDNPGGAVSSSFGVLITPTSGTVSGVTITGNLISGDAIGIGAFGVSQGRISGLTIVKNRIGPKPSGAAYAPFGNLMAIFAAGSIANLTVGGHGASNDIEGDVLGLVMTGNDISGAHVEANVVGVDKNLKDFLSSPDLGLHDALGIVLADTKGVTIGGPASADGSAINGSGVGVLIAGKNAQGNTLQNNVIGLTTTPKGRIDSLKNSDLGAIFCVLDAGSSGDLIGTPDQGNKIQGCVVGVSAFGTTRLVVSDNAILTNAVGVFGMGVTRSEVGGTATNAGNVIGNNVLGLFLGNVNLSKQEEKDAHLTNASVDQSDREEPFRRPNETADFNVIDATTTADIGAKIVDAVTEAGSRNVVAQNQIGASSETPDLGNDVAVIMAGDVHNSEIGGATRAAGNLIEDNHQAGIWLFGTTKHYPTVGINLNQISHNDDFTGPFTGIPGLGIDLVTGTDTSTVPGHGLGPDEQAKTNPAPGVNGMQNYPVVTEAKAKNAQISLKGTLQSAPNTTFTIEVYGNASCNPFKYGEGKYFLGAFAAQSNAKGELSFAKTYRAPSAVTDITATATSPLTSTSGGTSEFSKCETVGP